MRRDRHWDVIVVGARVAGASTAMLLARAGLQVLLVDRSRRGSDTLSTHALMRGGVLQLSRWGLLDEVIAAGTPPVRRTTFHYGDEAVPVSIKPIAGVNALYAPRRMVLDAILAGAAERAGATVRFGCTVVDLTRNPAGRVTGVVMRDREGEYVERAGLVVGADGRASLVADRAGAKTVLRGRHAATYHYGYWPAIEPDGYHWMYGVGEGSGLTAGVIPTNGGLSCVFIGTPTTTPAAGRSGTTAQDLHRQLSQLHPDFAERVAVPPKERVRTFTGEPARLRRAFGPGWALVGDAQCWKDPLSTHGMTNALRDAELLARAVVRSHGSQAEPNALAAYESERDRLSLPLHDVVDQLASHAWTLAEVQILLRALSSAMAEEVEAILEFDGPAERVAGISA